MRGLRRSPRSSRDEACSRGRTPGRAAKYFVKTECFCFENQPLGPGESKEMPLRFVVNAGLPKDVSTITLSYALFNLGEES